MMGMRCQGTAAQPNARCVADRAVAPREYACADMHMHQRSGCRVIAGWLQYALLKL
jgi:hypothetical protein